MTNKDLQVALQQYPDDYLVQLSIGEETDVIKHLFIDSDNGIIEITNYEDDDTTKDFFHDVFDCAIYNGSKVLFITFKDCNSIGKHIAMTKGIVRELNIGDNKVSITIEDATTNEKSDFVFDLVNGREPHGKIIRFEY